MRAAKALVSLCICAGSPEHSLFDNMVSTKISCLAQFTENFDIFSNLSCILNVQGPKLQCLFILATQIKDCFKDTKNSYMYSVDHTDILDHMYTAPSLAILSIQLNFKKAL